MTTIEQFEVVRMSPPGTPDFVIICSTEDLFYEALGVITADAQMAARLSTTQDVLELLEVMSCALNCNVLHADSVIKELRAIGFLVSEPVVVSFVTDLPGSETEPPEDET